MTTTVDPRAEGVHFFIIVEGIQMNQKELTKIFMMISNWKEPFGLHGLYRITQRCSGEFIHGRNYYSEKKLRGNWANLDRFVDRIVDRG